MAEIGELHMADNIILIGFMAVGKGRTARELSRQTGRYTVDTDDLIESLTKLKIKKIFARHGEPRFRALEQQTADWLVRQVRNTIVSTGGGFFKVSNLKQIGTVVYLHNEFEQILARIHQQPGAAGKIQKRPLLQDLEKARRLYDERLPQYRQVADLECYVGGRDVVEVAAEIVDRLEG